MAQLRSLGLTLLLGVCVVLALLLANLRWSPYVEALSSTDAVRAPAAAVQAGFLSGLPLVTENTYIQLHNSSASPANVVMTAFNSDGTLAGPSVMDQIPASGTKSFNPLPWSLSPGNHSVVVSSDQNVLAVATLRDATTRRFDVYQGLAQGSTQLHLGPVFDSGSVYSQVTRLHVQNMGTAPASVSLTFKGIPTGTAVAAFAIPPGATHAYDLATLGASVSGTGLGFVAISADQPIAAVAEHRDLAGHSTVRDATMSNVLAAPRFLNNANDGVGARTTIAIVTSPLTSTAPLTSTFRAQSGSVLESFTQTVPVQGGVQIVAPSAIQSVTNLRASGNAALQFGQVTLFESQPSGAYAGEYAAGSGTTIFLMGLRQNIREFSVIAVQNDAPVAAAMVMKLYKANGALVDSVPIALQPGGFYRVSTLSLAGAGAVTSALIESDQPISVWVDLLGEWPSTSTPTPTPSPTSTPKNTPTRTPTRTPTNTPTPPSSDDSVDIAPTAPLSASFASGEGQIVHISAPSGAVTETTTLTFSPHVTPAPGGMRLGNFFFSLSATRNGNPVKHIVFNHPVTLQITYLDADVAGLDGEDLSLAFFDEESGVWSSDGVVVVSRDAANNRLVVTITHLTNFGLTDGTRFVYLPAAHK